MTPNNQTRAGLLAALANAPANPGPIQDGLLGWWTDGGYVCAHCAGRIMAQGCRLPAGAAPVWEGGGSYGRCIARASHPAALATRPYYPGAIAGVGAQQWTRREIAATHGPQTRMSFWHDLLPGLWIYEAYGKVDTMLGSRRRVTHVSEHGEKS